MHSIIDPYTHKSYSINTYKGLSILKSFIRHYQNGGTSSADVDDRGGTAGDSGGTGGGTVDDGGGTVDDGGGTGGGPADSPIGAYIIEDTEYDGAAAPVTASKYPNPGGICKVNEKLKHQNCSKDGMGSPDLCFLNPETGRCNKIPEQRAPSTCRRNVDNNVFELIFALCVCDEDITDYNSFNETRFESYEGQLVCTAEAFNKYKQDLKGRHPAKIKEYILNLRNELKRFPPTSEVVKVYLEGKNITSQKIKELNHGVDIKKAKADVYIEYAREIIGFSIKQDKACTKSGFSVEKIIGSYFDKSIVANLKKKRKEMVESLGVTKDTYKQNRKRVNELFYDSKADEGNEYWNMIRQNIKEKNTEIKNELVSYLFPLNLPYRLFEYDGFTIEPLDLDGITNISFKEYDKYYYDKTSTRRKTAKMFYKLVIKGIDKMGNEFRKKYIIELRFKGYISGQAPQFVTMAKSDSSGDSTYGGAGGSGGGSGGGGSGGGV